MKQQNIQIISSMQLTTGMMNFKGVSPCVVYTAIGDRLSFASVEIDENY